MILQDIINTLSLPEFYFAVFRSATPVLLTTLGAMIASRSGTNNIALEGTMLISAFVGVVVSAFTQSAMDRLFRSRAGRFSHQQHTGVFYFKAEFQFCYLRYRLKYLCIRRNDLCPVSSDRGKGGLPRSLASLKLPSIDIPVIQDIPVIGAILSGHHVLTYAALILVAVI